MKICVWPALAAALLWGGIARVHALEPELARFLHEKEAQARELAETQTNRVPGTLGSFFDAVRVDDWQTATNLFTKLEADSRRYDDEGKPLNTAMTTPLWVPVGETMGTYELFHEWDGRWLRRFGRDILETIPRNSLYFGGTAPGRYLVTALSESQRTGVPFFTLTQNQLADSVYLEYLRGIYGQKIKLPSTNDYNQIYGEFYTNTVERAKAGRLRPGEFVKVINGKPHVFGQTAVMELNARLLQFILDRNAGREAYYEESLPLEQFYDRLEPAGLVFKLNREPLTELSEKVATADHATWKKLVGELIGDWIDDKTTVKQVCDFADTVYWRKELGDFKGSKEFVGSPETRAGFAKLRTTFALVYLFQAERAKDNDDRERLLKEASFAARQAFALSPASPEALNAAVKVAYAQHRKEDAILLADTALRAAPEDSPFLPWLRQMVRSLHADE